MPGRLGLFSFFVACRPEIGEARGGDIDRMHGLTEHRTGHDHGEAAIGPVFDFEPGFSLQALDREQRGAPRLAVALLDAVDSALRHAKKAPELGLAPAERRTRHAHGRGDEEAIALLPIAMCWRPDSRPTGIWYGSDLESVRFIAPSPKQTPRLRTQASQKELPRRRTPPGDRGEL